MEVRDILAMPRSHLYLWTTNNFLPEAIWVMGAWGFRFVTMLTWMKTGNPGLGQYHQGLTEHVLFGVRGKPRVYR
jgi:N6-adenosine-specific RNA methylase IME4